MRKEFSFFFYLFFFGQARQQVATPHHPQFRPPNNPNLAVAGVKSVLGTILPQWYFELPRPGPEPGPVSDVWVFIGCHDCDTQPILGEDIPRSGLVTTVSSYVLLMQMEDETRFLLLVLFFCFVLFCCISLKRENFLKVFGRLYRS